MLDYKHFYQIINEDNKVNKENYEEIEHYINKYEIGNYKSPYIKNKIKRCIDLISHFGNKIEYVKFNLSEISRMSDKKFNEWKNILDIKLNDNGSSSEEEIIKTDDEIHVNNGFNNIDFSKFNFNFKTNKKDEKNDEKQYDCGSAGCKNKVLKEYTYCTNCINIRSIYMHI